ncbi:MAG TPA: hypothetical protein VHJ38_20055 [Nitrososphaeraceae archaeon]|nr:hypothetical protein [Nitrososphaeraceae archaeon]
MAKFIPEKYVEPLVIIARIQGFDGIDDYIIHLIKDGLEMFTDADRVNLNDAFQKYMHNMIMGDKKDGPNTWRRAHSNSTTTITEVDDDTKNQRRKI